MIKTKYVRFKVSSILKKNYSHLNYDFTKEEVEIRVEDLKDVSQTRVDVSCDICGDDSNIIYAKYVKNVKRNGLYRCKECGLKNRSENFKNNNLSLNPDFQKKKVETFIKNYGVDNPSKSDLIKEKKKRTVLKKYGYDNPLKIRNLVDQGMIDKYGVKHALQSPNIYNKMVESLAEKYDVNNVSKLESVKNKKVETSIINNNVRNPMQNPIIFKKQLLSAFKIVYYDDTLFSQGSYELDFLRYCDENKILDLVSNGPCVCY